MEDLVTFQEIADHLGVNKWTIYRWLEWYFSDLEKPDWVYFPPFQQIGTYKYYKREDLHYFEEFKTNLKKHHGAMKEYNAYRFRQGIPKDQSVGDKIHNSVKNQKQQCAYMKKKDSNI